MGDQIIQSFYRIGSSQEISSPHFNFRNFLKSEKSTAESCRMHWNKMNDEEFGFFKFLIQPFSVIGSPHEISPPPSPL